MRSISEFYGRHPGADIYVVGTGTSLRVFPLDFLADKITIGLNQAWKVASTKYAITIMPKLNIPEFMEGEASRPEITWFTKPSKLRAQCTPEEVQYAEATFYGYENDGGRISITGLDDPNESGRVLDWVRKPHPQKLYLWTSISQSAMNLAANMGARNIILVGCDNASLGDNHHAHNQHTQWKGEPPDVRYMQYYEGSVEVRAALRERGVNVVSLTPFMKLDAPELDFNRLCQELGQETTIHNVDLPRGNSLRDDNIRYGKLTRYIIRKNYRFVRSKLSFSHR
jgi:hypothetical protein